MDNFKKILQLVKKTGDRCIITDNNSDEVFVLMTSEVYEGMLDGSTHQVPVKVNNTPPATKVADLSEEGLLDKINNDVANWKSSNDGK